jgi:hypothetical protein
MNKAQPIDGDFLVRWGGGSFATKPEHGIGYNVVTLPSTDPIGPHGMDLSRGDARALATKLALESGTKAWDETSSPPEPIS